MASLLRSLQLGLDVAIRPRPAEGKRRRRLRYLARFQLFRQLDARYGFRRAMHLHQTEFERSEHNCMINLPVLQPEVPPDIQEANVSWGQTVIDRWRAIGAHPLPAPRGFPYVRDSETVQWFRHCWEESQRRAPEIVVEVQNNHPRTPPEQQLALELAAIQVTVEELLAA